MTNFRELPRQTKMDLVVEAYYKHNQVAVAAAKELGVSRATIARWMDRYYTKRAQA